MVPTTSAMVSLRCPPTGIAGAPGSVRCLSVMRSYPAHTRKEPNSTIDPRSPLEMRCAAAQVFTPHQHRMLELAPDVAAGIGRDHADAGRPHQNLRDVVGPPWRIPDVDPVARAVLAEAVADQDEPDQRDQPHHALVGPLPDARDRGGARPA